MKRILSILLIFALLGAACERESEADNVVIFVKPSATTVNGGEKIYFDITSKTINQQLNRLTIESFDSINGEVLLYDEELSEKSISFRYVYDAPIVETPTLEVELTFTSWDNLGNKQWIRYNVEVVSAMEGLDELTGIALYSPNSNKEDAFSFRLMQRVKSREAEDGDVDIYVEADAAEENTLGRSWGSKTGVRFCKANNFNYAAASQLSIESVYNNSITSAKISDLEIEDIILVGNDRGALAAIRIVNIYDDEGSTFDRYDISMNTLRVSDNDDAGTNDTPPADEGVTEDEGEEGTNSSDAEESKE